MYRAALEGPLGFRKEVALKRIRDELVLCNPGVLDALINEARLGGFLRHPNVVEIYEFQEIEGSFIIAMEYVDGLPLDTVLAGCRVRSVQMPMSAVLDTADQICAGLAYAHAAQDSDGEPLNIVHRDMKPANIILTSGGVAKVVDFGIAMATGRLGDATATGMTKGTPYYMAPEQLQGDRSIDGRADMFAVGAIVYEMCTGEKLFSGNDLTSLFYGIVSGSREEACRRLDGLAPGLGDVVERCVAPPRDDRYRDMETLRQALREVRERLGPAELGAKECVTALIAASDPEVRAVPDSDAEFAAILGIASGLSEDTGWPAFASAVQDEPQEQDPVFKVRSKPAIDTHALGPGGRPAVVGPGPTVQMGAEAPLPEPARRRGWLLPALGAVVIVGLALWWWLDAPPDPTADPSPPEETAESASPSAALEADDPLVLMDLSVPAEPPPQASTPTPTAATAAVTPRAGPSPGLEREAEEAPVPEVAGAMAGEPVPFVINTLPWSTLTRGDQSVGRSPYSSELPAGVHRFEATAAMTGERHEFVVELSEGAGPEPLRFCWDFRTGAPCAR